MEKDLECESVKATENSSRFLRNLHFKKCLYESDLLLDFRGSQETTASSFLIITKLEMRQ